MVENKDLKTPEEITENDTLTEDTQEAAVEATEETSAETAEEATAEAAEEAAAEAVKDAEAEAVEETEIAPSPVSKKPLIQKTIVISIVIVVIAALAALVIKLFFNNDITGTWHLVRQIQVMDDNATSDEATKTLDVDYYFTFESDGTVKSTIGTVTGKGTYTTAKNEDGKTVVTVTLSDLLTQYFLDGEYTVELSGNIFTGRTMTFTSVENTEKTYEFTAEAYSAPEIKREDDFTGNDDIVGRWVNSTGEYTLIYEFNKDGTAKYYETAMTINPYTYTPVSINIEMSGIYTVKDDTVTISYIVLEQSDKDMKFRLDGDTLYINDYPFVREGAATPDQVAAAQAQ